MKYLFFSATQGGAMQRAYARNEGVSSRTALRVAFTNSGDVVAFTALMENKSNDSAQAKSMAARFFDDMKYVGAISSEEQILVSEDGVTASGTKFARAREIPATVKSLTGMAVNLA